MTKVSCDIMVGIPHVSRHPSLGAIGILVVKSKIPYALT